MKTPLHQLIDHLESYQAENNTDAISIDLLKRVIIEKFVPVEKSIIEDAFLSEQRDEFDDEIIFEDYYNETFKNDLYGK